MKMITTLLFALSASAMFNASPAFAAHSGFFCKSVESGQKFEQGTPFMQARHHAGRLMVTAYGPFAQEEFESDGPYVFQYPFRLVKTAQRAEVFTEGNEHGSFVFQLVAYKTMNTKFFKAIMNVYHDEGGFDHRYVLVCKRM